MGFSCIETLNWCQKSHCSNGYRTMCHISHFLPKSYDKEDEKIALMICALWENLYGFKPLYAAKYWHASLLLSHMKRWLHIKSFNLEFLWNVYVCAYVVHPHLWMIMMMIFVRGHQSQEFVYTTNWCIKISTL